jgi:hypothetical protein
MNKRFKGEQQYNRFMGREKLLIGIFLSFIFVALTLFSLVSAQQIQQEDSDADGIVDGIDVCPATNSEEGLPINVRDKDYLGCACSQIYEKTGENYCLDVFCSSARPLLIKERTYSSRETNCPSDYCVGLTLYDYPANIQVPCIDGEEEIFECKVRVFENITACINGSVSQYEQKVDSDNENIAQDLPSILLDDYEKLQLRAYGISQDIVIRTNLGISGEELFLKQSEKTMNSVIIEKYLTSETKILISTEKTISTKKIVITPNKHITLKEVYVFEELPRESEVELKEIIPGTEVVFQEGEPAILVWKVDKISGPSEITYQVVKPLKGESNTLIVAKEIKNNTWTLGFIPLAVILIFIGIFIYVSKKSVPRRTRIFKEK